MTGVWGASQRGWPRGTTGMQRGFREKAGQPTLRGCGVVLMWLPCDSISVSLFPGLLSLQVLNDEMSDCKEETTPAAPTSARPPRRSAPRSLHARPGGGDRGQRRVRRQTAARPRFPPGRSPRPAPQLNKRALLTAARLVPPRPAVSCEATAEQGARAEIPPGCASFPSPYSFV
ncbi:PREDICTED: uncharacterized protein LOC106147485 isoform X1 [Chinchilla lanigera]|uniref:uncharacterized protein LOC106147485 isoform X1 n=1 Tax=Chinchilla lanigera TaxID=34839 RepID=UPI000698D302|nr:PREDICTED: uncharacterized protein LOC106147485 isoform X1 [Chinchilla lanigera]